MGDPGYEASSRAADFIGAKIHRIPLRADFSHDVKAMVAADPNAGLFYICDPNNPTGTITSAKEDIQWLLDNKPKDSRPAAGRSLHSLLQRGDGRAVGQGREDGHRRLTHLLQGVCDGRTAPWDGGGAA